MCTQHPSAYTCYTARVARAGYNTLITCITEYRTDQSTYYKTLRTQVITQIRAQAHLYLYHTGLLQLYQHITTLQCLYTDTRMIGGQTCRNNIYFSKSEGSRIFVRLWASTEWPNSDALHPADRVCSPLVTEIVIYQRALWHRHRLVRTLRRRRGPHAHRAIMATGGECEHVVDCPIPGNAGEIAIERLVIDMVKEKCGVPIPNIDVPS